MRNLKQPKLTENSANQLVKKIRVALKDAQIERFRVKNANYDRVKNTLDIVFTFGGNHLKKGAKFFGYKIIFGAVGARLYCVDSNMTHNKEAFDIYKARLESKIQPVLNELYARVNGIEDFEIHNLEAEFY